MDVLIKALLYIIIKNKDYFKKPTMSGPVMKHALLNKKKQLATIKFLQKYWCARSKNCKHKNST